MCAVAHLCTHISSYICKRKDRIQYHLFWLHWSGPKAVPFKSALIYFPSGKNTVLSVSQIPKAQVADQDSKGTSQQWWIWKWWISAQIARAYYFPTAFCVWGAPCWLQFMFCQSCLCLTGVQNCQILGRTDKKALEEEMGRPYIQCSFYACCHLICGVDWSAGFTAMLPGRKQVRRV